MESYSPTPHWIGYISIVLSIIGVLTTHIVFRVVPKYMAAVRASNQDRHMRLFPALYRISWYVTLERNIRDGLDLFAQPVFFVWWLVLIGGLVWGGIMTVTR